MMRLPLWQEECNSTVTKKTFVDELNKNHGVVDTNNMSDDLKKAISNRGITDSELKKIAGADGQIKGKDEFTKLFKAVDQFDKRTPRSFESKYLTNKDTWHPASNDETKYHSGKNQNACNARPAKASE